METNFNDFGLKIDFRKFPKLPYSPAVVLLVKLHLLDPGNHYLKKRKKKTVGDS